MNTFPIGIIDSGLGGLSIWKEIVYQLPNESIVYIGDHRNLPYSNKKISQIRKYVEKLIHYLILHDVKLIVIACNTATVAGIEWYRKKFPSVPIIGVVPVVKTASEISKSKRFMVLSTSFTARSTYQKKLIQTYAADCKVYSMGIGNLVSAIESGDSGSLKIRKLLEKKILPVLHKGIDVIVLGCTHFPFVVQSIRDIVGEDIVIVDSGSAVARHVKRILHSRNELSFVDNPSNNFFTTGDKDLVSRVATILLQKNIIFTHVTL